jgi:hypothetical protein
MDHRFLKAGTKLKYMNLQDKTLEYTLISISETGEFSINFKTKLEMSAWLEMIANENDEPATLFLEEPTSSSYFSSTGTKYMIIQGIPVLPKSKQIVTKLVI